ncbi:MAG: methyltransferase, partial [Bacteroidales bacterium]|nr:methyltransferase [Bacteroidales bacterium]
PGGFILADNVLWSGKVIELETPDDEYTKGIFDFNDFLKTDNRVEKVILPLRDGLTLIRKK